MHGGHCVPRLDAYLEGQLAGRARGHVEHHLDHCADCRAEADRRACVLAAARTVHARPAPGPVMRGHGVPGRLVVGLLGFVVLLGALLTLVWMAGAPAPSRGSAAATPEDAAALVGRQAQSGAAAEELVEALREAGWSMPSLAGAGLRPLGVETRRPGEGTTAVAVVWGRTVPVVTVVECRTTSAPGAGAEDDAAPGAGCPDSAWSAVTASRPGHLEVGADYRIADLRGGGWTAEVVTDQAAYRVDAHLPSREAADLLTQLVVSERSGLAELPHEEAPTDRWERGLDRLRQVVPTGLRLLAVSPAAP